MDSLPVEGHEEAKRTNEIKIAIPLLETVDLEGRDITADALLTQRKIADYLVMQRHAHYHFTVKANQRTLLEDIAFWFHDRQQPDFIQCSPPDHGRIEVRKIWTTSELNDYLDFPHVQQAFVIERECIDKKAANVPLTLHTVSPAGRPMKPAPNVSSRSTGAIGPSRTAAIISSIGTSMKTEAESAPVMARKISRVCAGSPLASSNPKSIQCRTKNAGTDAQCPLGVRLLTHDD